MLSIPKGCYLVVFMPCDSNEYTGYDPRAWVVENYGMAIELIKEFMRCGDFVPEIDCRFEVFDDKLNPSGEQEMFQEMVADAILSLDNEELEKEEKEEKEEEEREAKIKEEVQDEIQVKEAPQNEVQDLKIEDSR